MVNGTFLIPAIALVIGILHILFTERKQIDVANGITNEKIIEKAGLLVKNNKMLNNDLDDICRLRRRKAHLQKDMQNCAGTWTLTTVSLFICEYLSNLPTESGVESTAFFAALTLAGSTFLWGMCYLWRLVYEINKINSDVGV